MRRNASPEPRPYSTKELRNVDGKPDVTHIDVRYVAELARIALTDDEARRFQSELGDILEYVGQLDELGVDRIEPTAHAAPRFNVMRDDRAGPTMDRRRALANAPAVVDDAFVRVPPVIEEEEH